QRGASQRSCAPGRAGLAMRFCWLITRASGLFPASLTALADRARPVLVEEVPPPQPAGTASSGGAVPSGGTGGEVPAGSEAPAGTPCAGAPSAGQPPPGAPAPASAPQQRRPA